MPDGEYDITLIVRCANLPGQYFTPLLIRDGLAEILHLQPVDRVEDFQPAGDTEDAESASGAA